MITLDSIAKEHFQGTKTFPSLSTKVMLKIMSVCLFVSFCRAMGTTCISFAFPVTATPCLRGSALCTRGRLWAGRLARGGRLPFGGKDGARG